VAPAKIKSAEMTNLMRKLGIEIAPEQLQIVLRAHSITVSGFSPCCKL
jgi:hypothetical protein